MWLIIISLFSSELTELADCQEQNIDSRCCIPTQNQEAETKSHLGMHKSSQANEGPQNPEKLEEVTLYAVDCFPSEDSESLSRWSYNVYHTPIDQPLSADQ